MEFTSLRELVDQNDIPGMVKTLIGRSGVPRVHISSNVSWDFDIPSLFIFVDIDPWNVTVYFKKVSGLRVGDNMILLEE